MMARSADSSRARLALGALSLAVLWLSAATASPASARDASGADDPPTPAGPSSALPESGAAAPGATDEPPPVRLHGNEIGQGEKENIEDRASVAAEAALWAAGKAAADGMTSRAEAAAEPASSEAMRALVGEMTPRILQALGVEDGTDAETGSASPPADGPEQELLAFVSSSMPIETLRAYAAQLEPLGGVMALRGGVGGLKTFAPTAAFIRDILKVDPACNEAGCALRAVPVLIDPILFRSAAVDRVPAFTVLPEDPFVAWCERNADAPPDAYRVSYGDASVRGHLEELTRLGDSGARILLAELDRPGGPEPRPAPEDLQDPEELQ